MKLEKEWGSLYMVGIVGLFLAGLVATGILLGLVVMGMAG
jgi:hypothetical protein